MTTTTEQTATRCTSCGAKIPRTVSICPYCVMPQQAGGERTADSQVPAEVVERLAHMREKDEYAAAMAWTPREGIPWREGRKTRNQGVAMAVFGLIVGTVAQLQEPSWKLRAASYVGLAAILVGAWLVTRGALAMRAISRNPLLKRAARVAERRSETTLKGSPGGTTYFFQLEFEDGTSAEFGYPGRGAAEEPLTNGVTGLAYTRGQELLAFERIRV